MKEAQETKNEPLTQDLYDHAKTAGKRHVALIILLSLVFGSVGGGFGAIFALKSSKLKKFLDFSVNQPLVSNQTIVLSEESSVIDVVKKASPAVVSIVVTKDLSKLPSYNPFFPFFENPGQKPNEPNLQKVGAGSGFLVSENGIILTNKHVVSDKDAGYTVILNDNRELEAKVMAVDSRNDLAILKVEIKDAPFLQFGNSAQIMIGQRVVAIGNSLGQYQNTVTTGVVSGIGRSITAEGREGYEQLEGVIQTDAAINPGNSGGPLLNTAGQVIGINTAIDQQGQSVGFAIPSNDAKRALGSYLKTGSIKRPFIGIRYIMITKALAEKEKLPKDYGALIIRGEAITDFAVVPGSPADKAGLGENDIILEINGRELKGNTSLGGVLREADVGETVTLKVYSKGEEKAVRVMLGEAK